MTDSPEPEPSNCSLLHNLQMSNKTTKDPKHHHYQYRSTVNHCPLCPFQAKIQLNLRLSVCCSLRLSLLFSQRISEASDFPLTVVTVITLAKNMRSDQHLILGILSLCLDISQWDRLEQKHLCWSRMIYRTHRPENSRFCQKIKSRASNCFVIHLFIISSTLLKLHQ